MKLRVHAIEPLSRANGPGWRAAVWLQGCSLGCPGCFNPGTHDPAAGFELEIQELVARLLVASRPGRLPALDGVSFSGGEPLQQPEGFLELLETLSGRGLSLLVFSGYTLAEIERQPLGPAILAKLDVLVAGRYVQQRHLGRGLLGSANQQIHLLTSRHTLAEFAAIPTGEIILHPDGSITHSGIESMPTTR